MIKLQRIRTAPPIAAVYHGTKRNQRELELLKMKRKAGSGNVDFKNKGDRWGAAKDQLKTETHGKCAYCEADTTVVAHGDVEHYRPKSKYWWLAYCYDNYLFSCQICNQSFKSDNFPVAAAELPSPNVAPSTSDAALQALAGTLGVDPLTAPAVTAFIEKLRAEKAHLPDPYDPSFDPRKFFVWEADEDNGRVRLKGKNNSAVVKRVVKACDDFLGLNREELLRLRWAQFKLLRTFKEALKAIEDLLGASDPTAQSIRTQIADMMAASSEYADLARFFVSTKWGLNIPVPA